MSKSTFVFRCVQEYIERIEAEMQKRIIQKRAMDTGEGLQSVRGEEKPAGEGAQGKLIFNEYLRFIDMGVGRAHPLGGLTSTRTALKAAKQKQSGLRYTKDKARKPKKIYASVIYGNLGYLANKLRFGYTEEVQQQLKQELENNNNNL